MHNFCVLLIIDNTGFYPFFHDYFRGIKMIIWYCFRVIDATAQNGLIHESTDKLLSPDRKQKHDDDIKWEHFPRYWTFVSGIHRSLVGSPHKGQWPGVLNVFFDLRLNKRLRTQSRLQWFETSWRSLWRHSRVKRRCILWDMLDMKWYRLIPADKSKIVHNRNRMFVFSCEYPVILMLWLCKYEYRSIVYIATQAFCAPSREENMVIRT